MSAQVRHAIAPLMASLAVGILCWNLAPASGQQPEGQNVPPDGNQISYSQYRSVYPGVPEHVRPQAFAPQRRRSIIHHYQYPYPGYYNNDETAGFRNPGGVGKYAEYYPPGNQFQVQGDPVKVAQFGVGGYPSRGEQMEAQRIGISRYNSIQNHIDNYARPAMGFGFGVGGFGGFW